MPVENYGVLKGKIVDGKEERDNNSPHYQIHVIDENGRDYRIAVNVMSNSKESEVLYLADDDFDASAITELPKLKGGFTRIKEDNRELALDYVRGNLIDDPSKMVALPHNVTGPDNDLNDFIQKYVQAAKHQNHTVYVYGSKFGPENEEDKIFHFRPEQGVHNVHMNQGNEGRWKKDNGIWQDGGILIQFDDKWVAIFLAFLTQSWCTDNKGNPKKFCSHKDVKIPEFIGAGN